MPKPDLEVVEGDRLLLGLAPEVLAVGEGGVRVLGGQRLVEVVPRVHPEDLDQGAVRQVQSAGAPGWLFSRVVRFHENHGGGKRGNFFLTLI